jgi:transcriptional regulator with GAF, ATPase, and Fis domain
LSHLNTTNFCCSPQFFVAESVLILVKTEAMSLEALQAIALAVAQERSLALVLKRIVEGLARQKGVALARVWLFGPGDICERCRWQTTCAERTRCLHLVASQGRSLGRREDWSRLNGDFCRFPLNKAKIGWIGATGESILIKRIKDEQGWVWRPDWAEREKIRSFAGHPLIFRGETLGVLAVFSRAELHEAALRWLQVFATQVAVAIANSRAFDEIEKLRRRLELENEYLREKVNAASGSGAILGQSAAARHVLEQIETVGPTDATVLILGESGVGKELVARAIHERSPRRDRPLVKVNCTAIPRELFESEFFGHVKGAFSGAFAHRVGRFQLADGGTLFLDEVGELPAEMQPKLLRVLQEGEFEPVGDDKTRRVDVRIMAATSRDLKAQVRAGQFRQDLYYRLSVFPLEIPPLRERKEDIPLLASHFLAIASRRFHRSGLELTAEHFRQLQSYAWPGNVRELQNVINRAVISASCGSLRFDLAETHESDGLSCGLSCAGSERPMEPDSTVVPDAEIKRRERENIIAALNQSGGRIYGAKGAAELLGLKPTTLSARLKKLGLRPGSSQG